MEWISVDEKAPELGQRVVCTGIRGAVFVGYYRGCCEGVFGRKRHVVSFSERPSTLRRVEIEAWMCAPEPYERLEKYNQLMIIRKKYFSAKQKAGSKWRTGRSK